MRLDQGPQCSDVGEARTRGPRSLVEHSTTEPLRSLISVFIVSTESIGQIKWQTDSKVAPICCHLLSFGTGCVSQNWYLFFAASSILLGAAPRDIDNNSTAFWIFCNCGTMFIACNEIINPLYTNGFFLLV